MHSDGGGQSFALIELPATSHSHPDCCAKLIGRRSYGKCRIKAVHAHSIAPHIYSVDHIVRTEVNIHPEVIDLTVTPDPSRIRIAFSCSVTVNYLEDMS